MIRIILARVIFISVTVRIVKRCRIVLDIAIEIQALWIAEVSVRNRGRCSRPIRGYEASDGITVVTCPEVIAAGFGVTLLAGEFVVIADARIRDAALAAEGIVFRLFLN